MKYAYDFENDVETGPDREHYVYIWFNCENEKIGLPFYVGKGSKNRYKAVAGRSKKFKEHINKNDAISIVVAEGLTESEAYWCEKRIKEELTKEGIKLIDGEHDKEQRKEACKEGIAAMPVVDGKKVSAKTGRGFGRPKCSIEAEEFQILLEKQRAGFVTVSECCSKLGIGKTTWYEMAKGCA